MPATTTAESPDASARRAAYTAVREDLLQLVPDGADRILDIGCSDGALGAALKAGRPHRHVTGVEIDTTLAGRASQRLDRVLVCDVEGGLWQEALASERFDCIVMGDVLEHLREPEAALGAAVRNLTATGCMVMSLPNIRHLSALRSVALNGTFPRRPRGIFDSTHLRWFTIGDARRLVAASGLAIEDEVFNLRWGDQGGGRANRLLDRLPATLVRTAPVRELLTYQYSLRAGVAAHPTSP